MKKLLVTIAACVFASTIAFIVLSAVVERRRSGEANKLGFDHMYPADVKGVDGKIYNVKVFWTTLRVIPSTRPVLVRVTNSQKESHDQLFSTDDRAWLTHVSVQRHKAADELLLEIDNLARKPKWYANRITPLGLLGYPQLREAEIARNRKSDERLLGQR
jgi:hypothetical protein